jgi:hypothetical protein
VRDLISRSGVELINYRELVRPLEIKSIASKCSGTNKLNAG